MQRRKIIVFSYIVLACIILIISFRCNTSKPSETSSPAAQKLKWLNLSDSAHYVGMNTCRQCHDTVYQSFIHTGMGQSFGKADLNKSAADFSRHTVVYDRFSDLSYMPFLKNGLVYLKEFRLQ